MLLIADSFFFVLLGCQIINGVFAYILLIFLSDMGMVFVCTLGLFGYCQVVVKILNLSLSTRGVACPSYQNYDFLDLGSKLQELLVRKTGRVLSGELPFRVRYCYKERQKRIWVLCRSINHVGYVW